ncbi:nitrite reductase [Streptomyces sp. NPDC057702]|uniref:nitrite reductase n=1 Tax=unclassified Streptomyces TaxID=2593676 RepID=UPI00368C3351
MPLTPTTAPTGEEPRSRTGGDACPGALRLHRADDGFLARVRLPGGLLTADQAEELALAAEALGDGALDLTSRGNVQLRGLGSGCGAELADRLRSAGLLPSDTHERVRNIALSPLSGLDGAGRADVTDWARELDGLLCGTPEAAGLSGRFLFAVDDGRGDVASLGADVTLIAAPADRALLRVATEQPTGHPSGTPSDGIELGVGADAAPRAALGLALAFLAAARESGTRAWRTWELPPRHALTERRSRAALADAGLDVEPPAHTPAHTDRAAWVTPAREVAPPPGLVPAPGGEHAALSVFAPLGRTTLAQWRLLVAAARAGSGVVRMTPWRGAVLPGLPLADAPRWLDTLARAGFVTDAESPWYGAGACTGRPGCAKSLADVRADAAEALAAAERGTTAERADSGGAGGGATHDGHHGPTRPPDASAEPGPAPGDRRGTRLPVYWSGCERRCGRPRGRWVDVLAGVDGYRVSIEGTERTAVRQSGPAPHVAGPPPGSAEARDSTSAAPGRPETSGPPARVGPLRPAGLAGAVAAARYVP